MSAALQPLLTRHKATLLFIEGDDYEGLARIWNVRLGFKLRGRKLSALFDAGVDVFNLMHALAGGDLTRETAGNLVRAGRADVLIGQPEGHWLEAKSQHYDLGTPSGEISLAQAVSRFCNSEDGGIVVVGVTTKKTAEGEHIRKLNPMPMRAGIVRKYHRVLENHPVSAASRPSNRSGCKWSGFRTHLGRHPTPARGTEALPGLRGHNRRKNRRSLFQHCPA